MVKYINKASNNVSFWSSKIKEKILKIIEIIGIIEMFHIIMV